MAQVKYATVEILETLTQKAEDSGKNRYPDVGKKSNYQLLTL